MPTKKNAPAGSFYAQHGFRLVRETSDGSLWALDLDQERPTCPEWIQIAAGSPPIL
jgi:predicted enzyme involved in methoxymalonyl-ACP biosynthesis